MTLAEILIAACDQRASDVVLAGLAPPTVWVHGRVERLAGFETPLALGQVEELFRAVLSDSQQGTVRQAGDLDWSESIERLVAASASTSQRGDDLDRGAGEEDAETPRRGVAGTKQANSPGFVPVSRRPGVSASSSSAPSLTRPIAPAPGATNALAGRIRINLHRQRGDWAAAMRLIPRRIPPLESLNLPDIVAEWVNRPRGLVLVTGPTGSGKSTTLAAIVQRANQSHDYHVITLEDPIEYEFSHGTCLIEQRQIGDDCPSFAEALRHVVRQRPDVILVGELRDRETIAAALAAAETGHLVLATLHTNSAPATVERIIDLFDQERQNQIRIQLAGCLQCILCQSLVTDRATGGLLPATEVLVATTAVRRAIRDGQTHLIDGMLETGQAAGMHSLEQDLARLLADGRISLDDALALCSDPEKLNRRRKN